MLKLFQGKLHDRQEIAVKRLFYEDGQGEVEFKNEVLVMARLQHRNLVRLQGFCLERKERLLIFEFVPNSSLDQFLFGISAIHFSLRIKFQSIFSLDHEGGKTTNL